MLVKYYVCVCVCVSMLFEGGLEGLEIISLYQFVETQFVRSPWIRDQEDIISLWIFSTYLPYLPTLPV